MYAIQTGNRATFPLGKVVEPTSEVDVDAEGADVIGDLRWCPAYDEPAAHQQ